MKITLKCPESGYDEEVNIKDIVTVQYADDDMIKLKTHKKEYIISYDKWEYIRNMERWMLNH